MKKILFLLLTLLVFAGCRDDNDDFDQPVLGKPNFIIYTVWNSTPGPDTVSTLKFYLKDSIVYSMQAISKNFPQNDRLDYFIYSDKGRLRKVYSNKKLKMTIDWNANTGFVSYADGSALDTVVLENGRLVYAWRSNCNYVYDKSGNLTATMLPGVSGAFKDEYLEYSSNAVNPFYLLRSIETVHYPVIFHYPFSKYVFNTRKAYPYVFEGVTYPERNFHYSYQNDMLGRVISIASDVDPLLVYKFEYK